jgi:putative oxidoreductase
MNPIVKLNRVLAAIGTALQSPFLLVIRLFWGWQFFETGKGKLSDISRPTQFFTHLHIPAPHICAILVGLTECVGGPLLLLGLATRFVAPILVFEMCMAYVTSEQEALHALFSNPDKFLGADPFLFLYASLIVFIFGPGRFSIDAWLFKRTASDTPPGA